MKPPEGPPAAMASSGDPGRVGACIVALLVLLALTAPLEAQRWRPDDRVLLTSFHLVSGLARDERHLYAATPGGLQILDMVSGRWELPSTAEDGFPRHEQPTAVTFDHLDRSLWLATLEGALYSYQVDFKRWTRESTPVSGPILRTAWLEEDGEEGLYLRTPRGWFRMPRSTFRADRVAPGEVPAVLRSLEPGPEERLARTDPAFAAARGTLLMDDHARRWPMTDFVPDLRQGFYWLATAGDAVHLYDSRVVSAEPHRFGLLSPSARSLARDDGAIWFGGDGRGPRRGVTRASGDLQDWRWYEAGVGGAPAREVRDILVGSEAVWFATPEGVYRLAVGDGGWRRMGGLAGSVGTHRLAADSGGSVWAATDRGVLRISGEESAVELARGPSLRSLLLAGDTLWVGGDTGVRRFLVSGRELSWPDGGGAPPTGRVVDLVRTGDRVWVATRDGALWRFASQGWEGPFREASQGGVDQILRLRALGDALWVGGRGGAARRDPETGSWSYLLVGRDLLGGPVWDLLPTEEHVFVATPEGVMRLRWREAF